MERRSYCPRFMDPWSPQQTAISSLNIHDLEGDLKCMWTNCHGKVDFADNRFSRSIKCFDNYTTELHRHSLVRQASKSRLWHHIQGRSSVYQHIEQRIRLTVHRN